MMEGYPNRAHYTHFEPDLHHFRRYNYRYFYGYSYFYRGHRRRVACSLGGLDSASLDTLSHSRLPPFIHSSPLYSPIASGAVSRTVCPERGHIFQENLEMSSSSPPNPKSPCCVCFAVKTSRFFFVKIHPLC